VYRGDPVIALDFPAGEVDLWEIQYHTSQPLHIEADFFSLVI
jgi:hypothetical protein